MYYDIISEYFPDLEEISSAQLASSRAAVVDYLRPHFPDHDMAPGSVFGDAYVSPLAQLLAALSISQNRFMSDLDLENVANGIIYSCKFVERYLGNFAVRDVTTLQSSGLVRLTFSEDKTYTVNKGVKFGFGSDDVFYPRLPSMATDGFEILPSGSVPASGLNQTVLVQTSLTTWAVDIPLTGKMSADVKRSTSGLMSVVPKELIGIVAAVDFDYGLPPVSLPALAEIARRTAYAPSVGSRNSNRTCITSQWPETKVVSVVLPGDFEMQRSVPVTPLALASPAADVYFRSKRDYQRESQSVKLKFEGGVFVGKVGFLHRPSLLEGAVPTSAPSLAMADVSLFSRISSDRFPGSTGCGTPYEEFWLKVTPPVSGNGEVLVDRANDENGNPYAMFTVTYLTDPLLEPVSNMLTSPDNSPVGLDVAVRAGPMIHIRAMVVSYRRKPGTTMALDTAREEITTYVNSVGWPELYSEAAIVESMYAAGALRTQDISYDAVLTLTPSQMRFRADFDPDTSADWENPDNSVVCPVVGIDTLPGMRPNIGLVGNVGGIPEVYAVSDKNVRYYLPPENIEFVEQQ